MNANRYILDKSASRGDIVSNSIYCPTLDKIPRFDKKLKLAVMASGNGTNFEALSKSIKNNYLDAEISVLIVNKENCNARLRAKYLGIECIFIDHRKYSSRESFEEKIISTLDKYKIEAIVMAGWMRIVTPKLIEAYPDRIINIHPSLLPSFKGANAIQMALDAKVKITGCTIHKVVDEIDSGEIIAQAAVKIEENDNIKTLQEKIQTQEHKLLPLSVALAAIEWRRKG